MKKLYLTIALSLLPVVCGATTYDIGPGETYETFAAFAAAVSPVAGDVIDGGGSTFAENITTDEDGESGNPIVYQNFTLTGIRTYTGWTLNAGTVYQQNQATTARFVKYNGEFLVENDGAAATVGSNEWDQDDGVIYVNVGEDPDNGTLEYTIQNALITAQGDYTTFDHVKLHYGRNVGSFVQGDYIKFTYPDVRYCYVRGIFSQHADGYVTGTVTGTEVTNGYFLDSGTTGNIEFSNTDYGVVEHNTIVTDQLEDISSATFAGGIFFFRGSDHNTDRYNKVQVVGDGISTRQRAADAEKPTYNMHMFNVIGPGGSDMLVFESADYNTAEFNTVLSSRDTNAYPCLKMGNEFGLGTFCDYNTIKNNIFYQTYAEGVAKRLIITSGTGGPGVGTHNDFGYNLFYFYGLSDVETDDVVTWYEDGEGFGLNYTWAEFVAYQSGKYVDNTIYANPYLSSTGKPTAKSPSAVKRGGTLIDDSPSIASRWAYLGAYPYYDGVITPWNIALSIPGGPGRIGGGVTYDEPEYYVLMETGDYFLMETGDKIILE